MGIGLYEYRAAIGAFAGIAARRCLRWRSKTKEQKSGKPRAVGGEERCEKGSGYGPWPRAILPLLQVTKWNLNTGVNVL